MKKLNTSFIIRQTLLGILFILVFQWVPYIIVVQGVLFLLPRWGWNLMAVTICNG